MTTGLITWCTINCSAVWQAILGVGAALVVVLAFLHSLLVVLENTWPGLKKEDGMVQALIAFLDKWTHGSGAWDAPVAEKPINSVDPTKAAHEASVKAAQDALDAAKAKKGMAGLGMMVSLAVITILVSSCSTVSWTTPVIFAGPTVALTEVNSLAGKTTQVGAGAGYQLTVGDGEFNWVNHSWDALDLSAIGLGSGLASGSALVGAIQIGGCVGTLNGIVAGCALSTAYSEDGSGWTQGGRSGTTWAGVIDVQAIIAEFGAAAASKKMRMAKAGDGADVPAYPRGGF